MEQSTLYTADGLKALKLRLSSTTSSTSDSDFAPSFVYPIFGEHEAIYGYRDLNIKLYFTSGTLKNYLGISYTGKPLSGDKALDIEGTLYEFIPPDYTKNEDTFNELVEKDEKSFRPLGTKIGEYARKRKGTDIGSTTKSKGKGKAKSAENVNGSGPSAKEQWEECDADDEDAVVFEAYQTTFDTPGFREYHRRMQIFVLLYIEGGSYIDEEDDRWEFVTLYEKRRKSTSSSNGDEAADSATEREDEFSWHFVGYTSLYRFFYWPDRTRLRLAQFVILPPYQGQGHGSTFYSLIYLSLLNRPDIAELTIEDPSEAFQDMRDKVDLRTLLSGKVFEVIQPSTPSSSSTEAVKQALSEKSNGAEPVAGFIPSMSWRDATKKEWKLAARQWARVLEMGLLTKLYEFEGNASLAKSKKKDREARETMYRLMVKERLWRFNYEILAPMEKSERRETLQSTYESVKDDYERLLESMGFL